MTKKVRVTVPYSVYENLENDRAEFEIEKIGTLGNKVLNYYIGREIKLYDLKGEKGEIIQFNLTVENNKNFIDGMNKTKKDNKLEATEILGDAEYIRNIFFNYLNNPKAKRERIAFNPIVEKIESEILKKKKIKITYGNSKEVRVVSPYDIVKGDRDNRIYLLCWCEKNNDYRSYRIAKMNSVDDKYEDREEKDQEFIERLKKNFDPFRTYGSEVVVRLTSKGERLLKSAITNRPKELSKEEFTDSKGTIYKFQCNEDLAKVYFPQFFSEVEMLEPESLREWFKGKYRIGLKLYEK